VEEVISAFRERFDVTVEETAAARESVQFKLPRALAG
ncbi:MAG: 4-hydroxy-3-methylbut-2-enyl diphosphate reductase, partial [Alphaproteobacteria bacterium]|nr:4-hydroxy-3-methylbut-2-enyl diphosphate reductase [Alphaproteobacteria bacterium]MDX5417006.1 4-hydroxy-3-methylbut-2-enyl diphosphate reductase [Alphaproteobacteria bacterium]MDX5494407.1 4-hydroxy-3-methylbut-2-enyl diphosphate reductase [Alphaproteobacteria bacterium]